MRNGSSNLFDDGFGDDESDDDESDDECPILEVGGSRLAYIKRISLDEATALGVRLPKELAFAENVTLYALHDADGTALGVTDVWASAYGAALQNGLIPLSVH